MTEMLGRRIARKSRLKRLQPGPDPARARAADDVTRVDMAPRHVQDIHGATRQQADLLGPLQRRSVFVGDALFGRLVFEYGESSVALATHVVESLGLALALEYVGLYG